SWTQNPWIDPRHSYWEKYYPGCAGEGFLLYPPFKESKSPSPCYEGGIPSIRWEMVRDGIEDYEYLWILRHYIEISDAPASMKQHAWQVLNDTVSMIYSGKRSWCKDPLKIYEARRKIAREIENLSAYIYMDISPPNTEIIESPENVTTQHTVHFSWIGEDDISSASNLKYSYILYGHDIYWSSWTSSTSVTYEDLPSGIYTFKVRAKDSAGNIEISPAEITFVINDPPIANFSFDPSIANVSQKIVFIDTSIDNDSKITNWTWDFGDGSISYGRKFLEFDGNDDRVKVSNSPAFNISDNITVEAKIWYDGGRSTYVEAEDTDKNIGFNYYDSSINKLVRGAVPQNGTGYISIYDFSGDPDLHYGKTGLFVRLKIGYKPQDSVNIIRIEVWDLNTGEKVLEDIYETSDFGEKNISQYWYGWQIHHHPTFFSQLNHDYRVKIYYYGQVPVYIDRIHFARDHRSPIYKWDSWRLYYPWYLQFLVWHPDGSHTHINYYPNPSNALFRKWIHVVGEYSSTDGIRIYLNGNLVGSKSSNGKKIKITDKDIYIGWGYHAFPGKIDFIRIYNRILTEDEIQQNLEGNVVTDGLIAWWDFEEGFGSVTHDEIGGNDGEIIDGKWGCYAEHKFSSSGTYTITLRIIDEYGLEDSVSKSITITGESEPPETTITEGPSGVIDYNDVTFSWSGSDDNTPVDQLLFSYKLEGYDTTWSVWSKETTTSYYDLPDGSYVFKVRTKDKDGNIDPTPAERDFTISTNEKPSIDHTHPENGKVNVTIDPRNGIYPILNVTISDPEGDQLTVIFRTNATGRWQTIKTFSGSNGTYTTNCDLMNNWLTWYWWSVNITDGKNWVNRTLCFRTKPADWDINMDNEIDIKDITAVTAHYGETGDPGWIREDINKDGEIDIKDITAVTAHYGENYG
ncbi:MAG TPA: DUF4091 domain-containing protein, partial [Thermoplasmatales archaeon]|nr:DUF4091 domain-containing protein [Thermoplasmatales archaeon]